MDKARHGQSALQRTGLCLVGRWGEDWAELRSPGLRDAGTVQAALRTAPPTNSFRPVTQTRLVTLKSIETRSGLPLLLVTCLSGASCSLHPFLDIFQVISLHLFSSICQHISCTYHHIVLNHMLEQLLWLSPRWKNTSNHSAVDSCPGILKKRDFYNLHCNLHLKCHILQFQLIDCNIFGKLTACLNFRFFNL